MEDGSGNFYGATMNGGTNFAGTIFEYITASNDFRSVLSFTLANGSNPNSPLFLTATAMCMARPCKAGPTVLEPSSASVRPAS